ANQVDCAIAQLDDGIDADALDVEGLGAVNGVADVTVDDLGRAVSKRGRTTEVTHGTITAAEVANVVVDYDVGSVRFDGQVEIAGRENRLFSEPGDSGALVLSEDGAAVALLFAGRDPFERDSPGVSYANPLGAVLASLGVAAPW
ncbi:MAG: hypothetical protein WBP81_11090, partial [Solirubrobacteraceae bacterium]